MNKQAYINKVSAGTFKILKEVRKDTFKVFNREHKKDNLIHIAKNKKEVEERKKKGWYQYQTGERLMRGPECPLVDLSDPYHNSTFNLVRILAYYRCLKKNKPLLKKVLSADKFQFSFLVGGIMEDTEIRVAGYDKRIFQANKIIFKKFSKKKIFLQELKKAKREVENRKLKIAFSNIKKSPKRVKEIYQGLLKKYNKIGKTIPDVVVKGIWKQLPEGNLYLFVPKSGLRFLYGFIEECPDKEYALYEYHTIANETGCFAFQKEIFSKKKVVVVDKCYTGQTLRFIAEKVKKAGGIPVSVSVFPKCLNEKEVHLPGFCFFLDKLVSRKKVLNKKPEEIFKRVANQR